MPSRRLFTKFDIFLVVASLVVAVVSLILIYDHSFFSTSSDESDANIVPIAKVTKARRDVRRRLSQDIAWLNMTNPDAIFEEDNVFTGDASEAEVKFNDGTTIALEPQTLIKITKPKSKKAPQEIQLSRGNMTAKLGSSSSQGLLLNTGGKTLLLKASAGSTQGAELRIVASEDPGSSPKVEVLQGQVEVTTLVADASQNSGLNPTTIDQNQTYLISNNDNTPVVAPQPAPTDTAAIIATAEPSQKEAQRPSQATRSIAAVEPPVLEEPAPSCKSEDPKQQEPSEFQPMSLIKVESFVSNTSVSAKDAATQDKASLKSQVNYGVGVAWQQLWSKSWQTTLFGGYHQETYEGPARRVLTNSSSSFVHYGIQGGFNASERLTVTASFKQSQELFLKGVSNAIVIDRAWITSLGVRSSFKILESQKLSLRTELGVAVLLPKQTSDYSIKLGTVYDAGLVMAHEFESFILSGRVYYAVRHRQSPHCVERGCCRRDTRRC